MFILLIFVVLHPAIANIPSPIDLTYPFRGDINCIHGSTPLSFNKTIKPSEEKSASGWFAEKDFQTARDIGTYMNAPFYKDGLQIGDIPVERLFGKAVYLNLRGKAEKDPDYQVSPEDLELWERQNGMMTSGSTVMLDFGWAAKHRRELDRKDTNNVHYPGLSKSGARWLVDSGKVYGVGTDVLYMGAVNNTMSEGQRVLADNDLYMMEQVAMPQQPLPAIGYDILVLPMKILSGTGAPCRVFAIPEKPNSCFFNTNNSNPGSGRDLL